MLINVLTAEGPLHDLAQHTNTNKEKQNTTRIKQTGIRLVEKFIRTH